MMGVWLGDSPRLTGTAGETGVVDLSPGVAVGHTGASLPETDDEANTQAVATNSDVTDMTASLVNAVGAVRALLGVWVEGGAGSVTRRLGQQEPRTHGGVEGSREGCLVAEWVVLGCEDRPPSLSHNFSVRAAIPNLDFVCSPLYQARNGETGTFLERRCNKTRASTVL